MLAQPHSPWSVLTANSPGAYYDQWALRSGTWRGGLLVAGYHPSRWRHSSAARVSSARVSPDGSAGCRVALRTRTYISKCTHDRRSALLGLDYDCQFAKPVATRAGCKDVAILLDPQASPFGVQSAFNGLAVYQVGALARHNATGCRFEGSRMSRICEHVPFSLCLGRHGLRLGVLSQTHPKP